MTFVSPLNIFVRELHTISLYGKTSTFAKFPIVSSTTIAKWYLSAKARRRFRSGVRRRGLDVTSQKRARIGWSDEGDEGVEVELD